MAWWEREYWRDDGPAALARARRPVGAIFLAAAHLTAFLVVSLAPESRQALRPLSSDAHPLGLLFHPLAFQSLGGLLLLGLALGVVGRRLEEAIGTRALLSLYALGNLAAGVAFFAIARTQPGLARLELAYPVGGLAAWAVSAWRTLIIDTVQIARWTPPLRLLFAGTLAILCAMQLSGARAGGVAWLAGVVCGALSVFVADRIAARFATLGPRRPRLLRRPEQRRVELDEPASSVDEPRQREAPAAAPEIDAILRKISREGIGSLTPSERERLEAARRALLRKT